MTDNTFIEMPMSLFQMNMLKPIINKSREHRQGVLLMTAAPSVPSAYWNLQVINLSQRGINKVRKIIASEMEAIK